MRKRKLFLLTLIPLVLLVLVGCTSKTADSDKPLSTAQIKKNIGSKLITTREDAQEKLTKQYQRITKDSNYTLDNPYVRTDIICHITKYFKN